MNFFRDRELATRFKNGNVTQRECFSYYIVISVIYCIVFSSPALYIMSFIGVNKWTLITDLFVLVSTIIGSIYVFKTNSKGDNKNFVERCVCIGFPVVIQAFLLMMAFSIVLGIVLVIIQMDHLLDEASIFDLFTMIFFQAYFFIRLNGSIQIASGQR